MILYQLTEEQIDMLIDLLNEKKAKIQSQMRDKNGTLITVYEPEEETKKQKDWSKGGHERFIAQVQHKLQGRRLPSSKGGQQQTSKEQKS